MDVCSIRTMSHLMDPMNYNLNWLYSITIVLLHTKKRKRTIRDFQGPFWLLLMYPFLDQVKMSPPPPNWATAVTN